MESEPKNIQTFCIIFNKKDNYEKMLKDMPDKYEAIIKRIKELLNEKSPEDKSDNFPYAKIFLSIKENKDTFQSFLSNINKVYFKNIDEIKKLFEILDKFQIFINKKKLEDVSSANKNTQIYAEVIQTGESSNNKPENQAGNYIINFFFENDKK